MSQNSLKSQRLNAAAKLFCELLKDLDVLERDPESCRLRWEFFLIKVQSQISLEYRYTLPKDAQQFVDTISDIILRLIGFTNPVMLQNMKEKFEFFLSLKRSNLDFSKAQALLMLDPWFAAWEPKILNSNLDPGTLLNEEQMGFMRVSITQGNRDLPY